MQSYKYLLKAKAVGGGEISKTETFGIIIQKNQGLAVAYRQAQTTSCIISIFYHLRPERATTT